MTPNKVILWPKLFSGLVPVGRYIHGGRGGGYTLGGGTGYGDGRYYNHHGEGFGFGPDSGKMV